MEKMFTTGQVAKIFKVHPKAIKVWFDAGELDGHRNPGKGRHRRITRNSVERLLKKKGISLEELDIAGWYRVLLVGFESMMLRRLRQCLPETEEFKFKAADRGFDAGVLTQTFRPDTVIIDLYLGRSETCAMAQSLKGDGGHTPAGLIGLTSEDDPNPDELLGYGFDKVFKKPFDAELLAEHLRTALRTRQYA